LFIAFMATSLLQMAQYALTPGIAKINAEVFTNLPLSSIQAAMTLPSLLSMVMSVISAWLIGKRLISKKCAVLVGLALAAATGVAVLIAHYEFWHLCMLSVLIGSGMGFFIAPAASIVFDNFDPEEVRLAVGYQSAAINFGGIVMSTVGGVLATLVWYGAYFTLLLAVPVLVLCVLAIPGDKRPETARGGLAEDAPPAKKKLPADIWYFSAIMFVFSMIFPVCGTNISSHLMAAGIGNTATAGIATAAQMAGGVFAGIMFSRLSARFRDLLIPAAFMIIFIGLTLLNIGQRFLLANMVGVFITGTSISIFVPQVLFATSNQVDASNSAKAVTIVNCVLPGLGTFLSPVVFTNLTTALGGPSTNFRYGFVGIFSLVCGIVLTAATLLRARRERKLSAEADTAG